MGGENRKGGVDAADLFRPAEELVNELVRRESQHSLSLEREITEANRYYEALKALTRPVDPTLEQHVEALQARALDPIRTLEKKLLKAEKRKFIDLQRQIYSLKSALFPLMDCRKEWRTLCPGMLPLARPLSGISICIRRCWKRSSSC
jgi:hypothetical protein